MKQITALLIVLASATSAFGQWQNKSFTHQGNNRQYRVYKSPNYTASNPASMVITLHGLGDNMTNFSGIGMNLVADTANIIVVVPQAMTDQFAGTAWNSGAGMGSYFPNSSINDVAFISDLIDTIKANYAINDNRVYACGFSMGGFMTNRLAVQLSSKITAFASVSGTFGFGLPTYNPHNQIAIAHFHGTADGTVPYAGNGSGIGVDSLINFWVTNNNCTTTPAYTALPDTQNDGYTVEHYVYSGGGNASEVEFFKVTGADHVWLTAANDISYTPEIWKFFYKHQQLNPETASMNELLSNEIQIYPNPSDDWFYIAVSGEAGLSQQLSLVDLTGKIIAQLPADNVAFSAKMLGMNAGVYLLKIQTENGELVKKVTVE